MLLEINGHDYSKNILVDTYEVNSQDKEIDSWEDSLGTEHRTTIEKTSGSMSMWFRNNVDYWQFQDDLAAVRDANTHAYRLKVARNNRREMLETLFFIELNPVRGRSASNQEQYRDFDFEIEER